jgi:hypothetical protein
LKYYGKKLRHELKYNIGTNEYGILRSRLRHIMKLDNFGVNDDSYFIRSLYFDDKIDSSLYDKNAGVSARKKYRIRIYNMHNDVIKLECKQKIGEYICKESAAIDLKEYYSIINNDFSFLKQSSGVKKEFYRQFVEQGLRPKVIVDYDREAYVLDASEVRITFDKELRVGFNSTDIFDDNIITYGVYDPGAMILEVKYNEFLPGYIIQLLRGCVSQYRAAISKYVLCRVSKGNIF